MNGVGASGALQTKRMSEVVADWDTREFQRSQRSVEGPLDAAALCAEIEASGADHVLVSFTTSGGVFFAIGLGAPDSCAVFWESVDPPYFQSRGQGLGEGGPVTYSYGGQPSEMPASVRISRADAFAALEEFMSSGQKPVCIEWDET
jgi:hypothetical protein